MINYSTKSVFNTITSFKEFDWLQFLEKEIVYYTFCFFARFEFMWDAKLHMIYSHGHYGFLLMEKCYGAHLYAVWWHSLMCHQLCAVAKFAPIFSHPTLTLKWPSIWQGQKHVIESKFVTNVWFIFVAHFLGPSCVMGKRDRAKPLQEHMQDERQSRTYRVLGQAAGTGNPMCSQV